jgi:hypothetical protein
VNAAKRGHTLNKARQFKLDRKGRSTVGGLSLSNKRCCLWRKERGRIRTEMQNVPQEKTWEWLTGTFGFILGNKIRNL